MKNLLSGFVLFFSYGAMSQCLSINCPPDVIATADSSGCTQVVNYTLPTGVDSCYSDTVSFTYSGSIDRFVVPTGITSLKIKTWGASGGNSNYGTLILGGQGTNMNGTFAVTPGQVLHILVGQAGETSAVGGGGGGTFVVDSVTQLPLIVAGGGGGASTDMIGVDASITQNGTMDALNFIAGGTSGNGGAACSVLDDNDGGGGGGFYTNGADANSNTLTSIGGFGGASYLNGGAGGIPGRLDGACSVDAYGGFGGGGSTSCNTVAGGGGGGYSGGGGGVHYGNCGSINTRSGGGGGGSFNTGTTPENYAAANIGNGQVEFIFNTTSNVTTTLISGLGSGGSFPIGTSSEVYVLTLGVESDTCSFNVTVVDSIAPEFSATLVDTAFCDAPSNIQAPAYYDNCTSVISYNLSGATTASGSGDASTATFNAGITNVEYIVTDESGNTDTTSFAVTINPLPNILTQVDSVVCVNWSPVTLIGTPAGGVWNGMSVSGQTFDPMVGIGIYDLSYTVTTPEGCVDSVIVTIVVDGCAALTNLEKDVFTMSPNPAKNLVMVKLGENEADFSVTILNVAGRAVKTTDFKNANSATIDLSDLANGAYFVSVKTATAQQIMKLIKE